MHREVLRLAVAPLAVLWLASCASPGVRGTGTTRPEPITPAELVASISDVAAGRNAAMAEAGLVLRRIEFKLSVGRETQGSGKIEVLVLDAAASRDAETSFLQEFTLEVPAEPRRGRESRPLVPGVREFIEDAMSTARDLARATSEAGLPQRIRTLELTARIRRSRKLGGGITATIPAWIRPSIGARVESIHEDDNTIRLLFETRSP